MKRIWYSFLILAFILTGWLAWQCTSSYFLRTGLHVRYLGMSVQQPGAVIVVNNRTHRKLTYWVTTECKAENGWLWPPVPIGTPLSTLSPEREIHPGQSTNLVVAPPVKKTPWRVVVFYWRTRTMNDVLRLSAARLLGAPNTDPFAGRLRSEQQGYVARTQEISP